MFGPQLPPMPWPNRSGPAPIPRPASGDFPVQWWARYRPKIKGAGNKVRSPVHSQVFRPQKPPGEQGKVVTKLGSKLDFAEKDLESDSIRHNLTVARKHGKKRATESPSRVKSSSFVNWRLQIRLLSPAPLEQRKLRYRRLLNGHLMQHPCNAT